LYELDLPWVMEIMDRGDPDIRDKPPIVDISPNGRMPLLVDPNTGIKLWESAAIIEYLLDEYDQEVRLRYTESPQKYEQRTWAYFQMSGQGPYFGMFPCLVL
jgi:glutathione S-transferase